MHVRQMQGKTGGQDLQVTDDSSQFFTVERAEFSPPVSLVQVVISRATEILKVQGTYVTHSESASVQVHRRPNASDGTGPSGSTSTCGGKRRGRCPRFQRMSGVHPRADGVAHDLLSLAVQRSWAPSCSTVLTSLSSISKSYGYILSHPHPRIYRIECRRADRLKVVIN